MSKPTSGVSAARRNAEALLNKTKKRESDFKLEQQRENEALALKTARRVRMASSHSRTVSRRLRPRFMSHSRTCRSPKR